ncbi:MAG: ABC transporter substrate-binding protein [bacterium]
MKKKIFWTAVVIVLVSVFLFVTLGDKTVTPSANKDIIKIGVVLPLSGNLAFLGESAKNSANLALSDYGITKNDYQLVFEDDQFDGKKTVTAVSKLISADGVKAIVTFGSGPANSAKPLVIKNDLIHLSVVSDQTFADGKNNFNHWTAPVDEVTAMVQEFKNRNIKKVALFTANQDGMLAINNEIKKQLKGTEIVITTDETFNFGEKDFRSQIIKIKSNLPDIIVLTCFAPELDVLGKQIKDAGITVPMTSEEGMETTTNQKLFNGYWYVSAGDPSSDFVDKYKSEFSSSSPMVGSGNVYDIVKILVTAYEKSSDIERVSIAKQLLKIKDFSGAMGNISMKNDGNIQSKASVKAIIAK